MAEWFKATVLKTVVGQPTGGSNPLPSAKAIIMSDISNYVKPLPADIIETYHWLDKHLLTHPGTVKEFQPKWQAYKYLINNKMYAYIGVNDKNDRPIITLKLEPAFSETLRQQYPDIVEGYYMNKQNWSTIYLDGKVPQDTILNITTASYNTLLSSLSKKAQQELKNTK